MLIMANTKTSIEIREMTNSQDNLSICFTRICIQIQINKILADSPLS